MSLRYAVTRGRIRLNTPESTHMLVFNLYQLRGLQQTDQGVYIANTEIVDMAVVAAATSATRPT